MRKIRKLVNHMNHLTYKSAIFSAIFIVIITATVCSQDFPVPATISPEAQAVASKFTVKQRNMEFPQPDDMEGWKSLWAEFENGLINENQELLRQLGTSVKEKKLGGLPVLDIKPIDWQDNGKVLIYTHGGAYTLFSASSQQLCSAPVAQATGLRVISVDYTVAPLGKWPEVTAQVVSVIKALVKEGYALKDIAIYGDSAGGGLAAGAVLRARDEGVGLIGCIVLWSPWADITETGDSYTTLKDFDSQLVYDTFLNRAAAAYADPKDQKHPYVSPVYGDYTKGFPPTLIQVGTSEIFLSNAVRLYRAIDEGGNIAKIDPYEGMWHVFQFTPWDIPESYLAREKMAVFLKQHLDY